MSSPPVWRISRSSCSDLPAHWSTLPRLILSSLVHRPPTWSRNSRPERAAIAVCDISLHYTFYYRTHALRFCFYHCLWLFLFVYEISREPVNGFAPNSQRRRDWSLARISLNVKVNGQCHHGQKTRFSADISGISELICDKLTRKTCLVPRSD